MFQLQTEHFLLEIYDETFHVHLVFSEHLTDTWQKNVKKFVLKKFDETAAQVNKFRLMVNHLGELRRVSLDSE